MSYRQIRFANLKPEERMMIYGASQISLCREEGAEARKWLTNRGLDVETISNFRLGYVPFNVDHAFIGRIVIPIYDPYGKLIALSVRPATDDKEILSEYKKYWNESYEKGWNLFGLNLARKSIVKMKFAILVEGQFDVMVMHSFGFTNTVGVLGGAFTPMQAQLLKLWTDQVIPMFDGDEAGKKHANKCEEILNYYSLNIGGISKKNSRGNLLWSKVTLGQGKDPAEFLTSYGSYPMRKTIIDAMKHAKMTLPKEWK